MTELASAIEVTFHYARSVARADGVDAVPAPVRPLLGFSRLPEKALDVVRQAVDEDEGFRLRAVEALDESDLGVLGWVWLSRPEGWQDRLADALESTATAAGLAAAEARLRDTQRRLGRAETQRDEAQSRAAEAETNLGAALEAQRAQQLRNEELSTEVEHLREELARVSAKATALDRRATSAEAKLGEERRRNRELASAGGSAHQTTPAAPAQPMGPEAPNIDPQVEEAIGELRRVAAALEQAIATGTGAGSSDPSAAPKAQDRRRRRHRLLRGVVDDSADGLRALIDLPDVRVLVDGYNVSMLGWPMLDLEQQRARLVAAIATAIGPGGPVVDVVFDGDDHATAPRTSTSPTVRVTWSPSGVTADDVIVDTARSIDPDVVVVVVTDDREVRDRAARCGCNVVGSRSLIDWLDRTVPPRF